MVGKIEIFDKKWLFEPLCIIFLGDSIWTKVWEMIRFDKLYLRLVYLIINLSGSVKTKMPKAKNQAVYL